MDRNVVVLSGSAVYNKLRTVIHASFPVVAARKVQTPFRVDMGYANFLNSFSLVRALQVNFCVSLAIICTFFIHAVSVARFCTKDP